MRLWSGCGWRTSMIYEESQSARQFPLTVPVRTTRQSSKRYHGPAGGSRSSAGWNTLRDIDSASWKAAMAAFLLLEIPRR